MRGNIEKLNKWQEEYKAKKKEELISRFGKKQGLIMYRRYFPHEGS